MSESDRIATRLAAKSERSARATKVVALTLKMLVLGVLLVVYLLPFYIVVLSSFKTNAEIITSPLAFPGTPRWANFTTAFEKMHFLHAMGNSFLITTVSVALIAVLSAMCAYMLVRNKWRINTVVYLLMVAAMIVPFQAIMIPLMRIYGPLGMMNSPWALIFMYVGFGTSFAVFLFHGFIKGVPIELEEAATMDGCSRYGVFFRVVIFLLQPVFVTVIILDVLWIWNDFLLPSLVLLKSARRTLPLSTYYFYSTYFVDWGLMVSSLVMTIIPVVVLYLFLQRYIIKGITTGAIK